MKFVISQFQIFFLIVLFSSQNSISQITHQQDSIKIKIINTAKEIMSAARYCSLITLDETGRARARIMDPFLPQSDFTIWLGTNPNSRKVAQIMNNPRVTLYYIDKDYSGYVLINGTAQLVNDPAEKLKWWKDAWEAFYPDRENGYLLIKVIPHSMEVLSTTYGILGDEITWQPPIVFFEDQK